MANTIRKKQLLDLPVYSRSGDHLGRVADIVFNLDTRMIEQYIVRPSDVISSMVGGQEVLVHERQVISITSEKMVVDDTTTAIPKTAPGTAIAS